MSDLVTGEAVVLDLQTAKLPSRALAILIDLLLEFAALIVTTIVLSVALIDLDRAAVAAVSLGLMVFFLVAVPVIVETLSHGRSLGKAALGLRVVRGDGGPVRFRHSLVRAGVGFFELITLVGCPAVITSALRTDGKRLGDVFAGTVVVRERAAAGGGTSVPLPPVHPQLLQSMGRELVAMDFSAVPEPLWLAIRQLLGRIGQLDPAVTHRMSVRLADDLSARTGLAVPPGLHPAAYLGAVLTERQRREWTRAQERQWQAAQAAQAAYAAQYPAQYPVQYPAAPAPAPEPQDARPVRVLGIPEAPAAPPAMPATPAPLSLDKPTAPPPPPASGFAPPA
ncbi:RDD family protein [Kitasatospora sp. NPDC101183]|uniref:RDD family protein n=1 Tax=Kitasatospora sp. NPDC101183 TaxID=3364100 RepID=UPI00382141A8